MDEQQQQTDNIIECYNINVKYPQPTREKDLNLLILSEKMDNFVRVSNIVNYIKFRFF